MKRVAVGDPLLRKAIDMLKSVIERLSVFPDCIMLKSIECYVKECDIIVNDLLKVLPNMFICYTLPEMSDVAEEASYWPGQVQKMCDSVKSLDRFAIYDSFYNETYKNLCEFREIIRSRNINLDRMG